MATVAMGMFRAPAAEGNIVVVQRRECMHTQHLLVVPARLLDLSVPRCVSRCVSNNRSSKLTRHLHLVSLPPYYRRLRVVAPPEVEDSLCEIFSEPFYFQPHDASGDPSSDSSNAAADGTASPWPISRKSFFNTQLKTQSSGGPGSSFNNAPSVISGSAAGGRASTALGVTSVAHLLATGSQPCISSHRRGIHVFADWCARERDRRSARALQAAALALLADGSLVTLTIMPSGVRFSPRRSAAYPEDSPDSPSPTLCAWSGILRAPGKRSPLGFVTVAWDSAGPGSDLHPAAKGARRAENGARRAQAKGTAGTAISDLASLPEQHSLSSRAVMLEDFCNTLSLSLSLWTNKMDHDTKRLAISQVQLQRRFLVRGGPDADSRCS